MYNGAGVQGRCCVGLATNQGRRKPPQGSPPEQWPRKWRGQGQRSILVGGFHSRCGYRLCGGCEGAAGPGRAKTSPRVGEKRFPGGFSAAPAAMVKKPAGLKTRPAWKQLDRLGGQRPAWPSRLGPAVCRSVWGCQAWRPRPCTP
jgi:hypothetical protein